MAPCRQLLMWSVPSIAVLIGIFWFKKKREYAKSDPGGRERIKSLKEELAEALNAQAELNRTSPLGKAERSIIKSAPIDIIPKGSGSQRSSFELTDEEVDLEIEKIIRKKSLEKDKKLSVEVGKQYINNSSYVSSNLNHTPVAVKESIAHTFSPLQTEMSCNKGDMTLDSKVSVPDVNILEKQHSEDESVTELLHQDSTNFDNNKTEDISTEDGDMVNDHDDLNINNNLNDNNINEASESNESNNTYSSQTRRISERDSANHSPVDPLLASPSMCHFSDSHSEVCNKFLIKTIY